MAIEEENGDDPEREESLIEQCVYMARRYAMTIIIPVDVARCFWDDYDCLPRDWFDFIHIRGDNIASFDKSIREILPSFQDVLPSDTHKASFQTFHGLRSTTRIDV